jgi:hypothetical protein
MLTSCKKDDSTAYVPPAPTKITSTLRDSLRYVAALAFNLDSANYDKIAQIEPDLPGSKIERNMESADGAFIVKAITTGDTTHVINKTIHYVMIRSKRSPGEGVQYSYTLFKAVTTGDDVLYLVKYLAPQNSMVSQLFFTKKK